MKDLARLSILLFFCLAICVCPLSAGAESEPSWLSGVRLDRAIRIGTGKKVVIEISDPDCLFSRRMVSYWDLRHDVTRYVFLVALKSHPEAAGKIRYILCARDGVAAYREVYSGGLDFGEKEADRGCDDKGMSKLHRQVAEKLGFSGTPTYFVQGSRVDGAKVGEIERILGGEKFPFTAADPDW